MEKQQRIMADVIGPVDVAVCYLVLVIVLGTVAYYVYSQAYVLLSVSVCSTIVIGFLPQVKNSYRVMVGYVGFVLALLGGLYCMAYKSIQLGWWYW